MGESTPSGGSQVADSQIPWLDEDESRRGPAAERDEQPREEPPEPEAAAPVTPAGQRPVPARTTAPPPPVAPPTRPVPAPGPARPHRRRAWVAVLIMVLVIALAVATVLLAVLDAGEDDDWDRGRPVAHTLTAPIDDRQAAVFELVSGASAMTVRTADLGDSLYRVATPEDGDSVPKVLTQGTELRLHLTDSGQTGPSAVDVQLSSRVKWTVRIAAGATEQKLDLSAGGVAAVDLAGGATTIDLTLPRPDGTLPVRMSGGASQFTVRTPAGIPARVRIGSGAGRAILGGQTHNGIAAGRVFTPDGWDRSTTRYDIDAVAGVSQLTVVQR